MYCKIIPHICLILLLNVVPFALKATTIGGWQAHLSYRDITYISPTGEIIYVLGSGNLFSYNTSDNSVYAFNKMNYLSDCTIEHMRWNKNCKTLLLIYDNYNIDLLNQNSNVVENITGYKNKLMTEDKTVNNVYINSIYAYICTNFGIIKLNMRDAEISETYNLGKSVTNCTIEGNKIYIKTNEGFYSANVSDNLIDSGNWEKDTSISDSLFEEEYPVETIKTHGYDEVRRYDTKNKCWWSSQEDGKLQSYIEDEDGTQTITRQDIIPDGPKHNHFGFMTFYDSKLYTCSSTTWGKGYGTTIQVLSGNNWEIFKSEGISEFTVLNFTDMMCLAIDPLDTKRVMGGSTLGVCEFYDGNFVTLYNSETTNGMIGSALGNKKDSAEYNIITSMVYDKEGNLWVSNFHTYDDKCLLKYDRNGNWSSYTNHTGEGGVRMYGMMFDNEGYLWYVQNYYDVPGAYRFDIQTGTFNLYNNFINQDYSSIEVNYVRAIAEDFDNNIWVGTNNGLLMLTSSQVNDPSLGFTQIKISRNDDSDLADYLLSNSDIIAIVVDGANRKWIGTADDGVYLIGSDSKEEVLHFTSSNSELLSNNIESLSINNATGEVFIGTDKGLCSYMSDASEANEDMTPGSVYAYPNPVKPGYNGLITIMGLSFNANVKILSSNGTLIKEGTSSGGMFTWDGKDRNGRRVASGIYLVATAKSDGSKGTVCKIAIIN